MTRVVPYQSIVLIAIVCSLANSSSNAQNLGGQTADAPIPVAEHQTGTILADPLSNDSFSLINGQALLSQDTSLDHERLRQDVEDLRREVERLRHEAQASEAAVIQNPQLTQQVSWHQLRPPCVVHRVPGWQRARSSDWMSLGRLQRMTTQIGQAGDMDLYLGLQTVGRLQYLQQSDVADTVGPSSVVPGSLEPGIQTPFGQFLLLADFDDGAIEVYMDVFVASRPHEDQLQADEGYMLFRRLPGPFAGLSDYVQIKAGGFEMDFGDAHYRRSNNGDVQRNPLIGNYVIDPRAIDIGAEFFSPPGSQSIRWLVGVGVGNSGDFQAGRGWQVHGKLFAETQAGLRPSVSFFWSDHADNPTGFPNSGSKSDLFRSNRSGGPYEDVLDGGNAPGQILAGNGQKVSAVQFDLTWLQKSWEHYGHFGMFQDVDVNGNAPGTPTESWLYYTGESVYRFSPRLYAAGRYSGAAAQHLVSALDGSLDVDSDGSVHRFQLGGGYWAHDMILAKLEYVYQFYDGFTPDGSQVSGVDVWNDPSFNGVLMEISFTL